MSDDPRAADRPVEVAERPGPPEHKRDGIGENDAPIPLWFNVTFLASIVFAVVYVPYYHVFTDWSARGQYEAEVALAEEALAAVRASQPTSNPYHGDAQAVADGQQVFATICSACHKPDGSGLVGPSLVDPYWKYGSDDEDLLESVMTGRPGGMPGWGPQLGADKAWRVLAYLETLPKSDVPGVGAPGVGGDVGSAPAVSPAVPPAPSPAPSPGAAPSAASEPGS